MSQPPLNALEIFKALPKTNCKECGSQTCMAFAALVLQKHKDISECPYLDSDTLAEFSKQLGSQTNLYEEGYVDYLQALKSKVTNIDFEKRAEKLDARFADNCMAVQCLGRIFEVDKNGDMRSECHVNQWVHVPLLHYIVDSAGVDPFGDWILFSELKNSFDWANYFSYRCVKAMLDVADENPEMFFDIMDLFYSTSIPEKVPDELSTADYAVIIKPLPKVPILIGYWKPEDQFESKLIMLFDRSCEENSDPESVFMLVRGLVEMLKKIKDRHE